MDTKTVIELIETVSKTLNEQGFEHITLNHEGTMLTLNKQSVSGQPLAVSYQPTNVSHPISATKQTLATVSHETSEPDTESEAKGQQASAELTGNYTTIDSPIVGTFYNAPSPDAEAYIKVGDQVKKGDVVCIVEAMKLMNEIEAECDGEVVEILVNNEGPVEYGQALFKIRQ